MTIETPVLPEVAMGKSTAVADCLDRYGNLVWSLALRSCPDPDSAQDAVQDIFLKLWKTADRFDPEIASESTFVAMIARRRLIDLSRKRRWASNAEVDFERIPNLEMNAPERIEINEEAAKAQVMLESLTNDQKQVIKLSIYDGLSHSRISAATGLSLGTVKTHLRRGLRKLREALLQAPKN
jgi:RNA polymerase sigma factor (sigma-70 family)